MSLRKETEELVPSLSAHLYSQFSPAVPGSPYTKIEARAALIHREDTAGKACMYFSSEHLHSLFIFIAVFQLNAFVSMCSEFCFLSKHFFPVTPTHVQKKPSPDPTYLWLKCCVRTSLPFSTKASRMWMALIFRWAFP